MSGIHYLGFACLGSNGVFEGNPKVQPDVLRTMHVWRYLADVKCYQQSVPPELGELSRDRLWLAADFAPAEAVAYAAWSAILVFLFTFTG